MDKTQRKITDFQVWLAAWMHKTEPRSELGVALKEADEALDLVFRLAGEEA